MIRKLKQRVTAVLFLDLDWMIILINSSSFLGAGSCIVKRKEQSNRMFVYFISDQFDQTRSNTRSN